VGGDSPMRATRRLAAYRCFSIECCDGVARNCAFQRVLGVLRFFLRRLLFSSCAARLAVWLHYHGASWSSCFSCAAGRWRSAYTEVLLSTSLASYSVPCGHPAHHVPASSTAGHIFLWVRRGRFHPPQETIPELGSSATVEGAPTVMATSYSSLLT